MRSRPIECFAAQSGRSYFAPQGSGPEQHGHEPVHAHYPLLHCPQIQYILTKFQKQV